MHGAYENPVALHVDSIQGILLLQAQLGFRNTHNQSKPLLARVMAKYLIVWIFHPRMVRLRTIGLQNAARRVIAPCGVLSFGTGAHTGARGVPDLSVQSIHHIDLYDHILFCEE